MRCWILEPGNSQFTCRLRRTEKMDLINLLDWWKHRTRVRKKEKERKLWDYRINLLPTKHENLQMHITFCLFWDSIICFYVASSIQILNVLIYAKQISPEPDDFGGCVHWWKWNLLFIYLRSWLRIYIFIHLILSINPIMY